MATDLPLDVFVEAVPPAMQLDYVRRAEARGWRAAWFPEITFGDAFGPAAAAAASTSRIGLATGVVGLWSRSPVTMALQAATVNELSSGRMMLGLGVQARGYVEGWHGRRYERPLAAMRDYLTILRRALAGEQVTHDGEVFSVRGFQLMMQPPERPVRIYVAAIGPKMIQLTGELADGLLGYFYSAEYVRDVVLPNLELGAARAGRSLAELDICCGFPTVVTDDDSGLELVKGQCVMFATATGSSKHYADCFRAAGFGRELAAIQERVAAGDMAGALGHVTDELADRLTIAGSPARVRRRIDEYRQAGLTSVALNPSPPGAWFPLYQGHFPDGVEPPAFDFPAYLGVIERTIDLLGDPGQA